MTSTPSTPAGSASAAARAVQQPEAQRATASNQPAGQQVVRAQAGYGLPCAKCRTYYAADLKACPVCKGTERVSAAVALPSTVISSEQTPDPAVLEQERERFLREFKAKVFASQMPMNAPAPNPNCIRGENHPTGSEPAAVCQECYEQLQERVDVLEAALHMDLKEAAQIVYDAVWSDPSDSSKTYQNAAHALLTELRKRSGVTPTFGPLQPMMD